MAHAAIFGTLDSSDVALKGGDSEWPDDYAPTYSINGIPVASWLNDKSDGLVRSVALIAGDSLIFLKQGFISAYQAEAGYSEVTTGSAEMLRVGGHDLSDYFERLGVGSEVVIVLVDPALDGDVTEVLLAAVPGLDPTTISL